MAAGDHITASVVRSGASYTLKVTDATRPANSFSTTQSCSGCANSSAEWIVGGPSGSDSLSDFHTWTVTGATVSASSRSGSICSFPYDSITMIGSTGDVKAAPSDLSGCNSFTVTWEHST